MARFPSTVKLRAILTAVGKASNRNSKSVRAMAGNNMFYAGTTLLFMMDAPAFVFFLVIMSLVMFLPSSGDPMALAPRDRLALWPLTIGERRLLRLITPWLNPLTWVIFAGLLWRRITWGLWAFVAAFFAAGFIGSSSSIRQMPFSLMRYAPSVPGPFRLLIRKDLRQMLCTLDVYCALLMSVPALVLRLQGKLPADAHAPLTMVVIIMMSTIALTLFGLEGEGGLTRYRLLPLSGAAILSTKGGSYLTLMFLLTAPLAPLGGLAGGLLSLAAGQYLAVTRITTQSRWRFRASNAYSHAVGQMLLALIGSAAVMQVSWLCLLPCALIYGGSLWWCGRRF